MGKVFSYHEQKHDASFFSGCMTGGMIAVCGLSINLKSVFDQITYHLFALISFDASLQKTE